MKDDLSEIVSANCYIILDSNTILGKTGNSFDKYVFLGDKWYLTREYDSTYSQYDDYNCIDFNTLSSKNSAFAPIYLFISLLWVILVIYFVYAILFRGLLKREI